MQLSIHCELAWRKISPWNECIHGPCGPLSKRLTSCNLQCAWGGGGGGRWKQISRVETRDLLLIPYRDQHNSILVLSKYILKCCRLSHQLYEYQLFLLATLATRNAKPPLLVSHVDSFICLLAYSSEPHQLFAKVIFSNIRLA